jgi:hypothetical protein
MGFRIVRSLFAYAYAYAYAYAQSWGALLE